MVGKTLIKNAHSNKTLIIIKFLHGREKGPHHQSTILINENTFKQRATSQKPNLFCTMFTIDNIKNTNPSIDLSAEANMPSLNKSLLIWPMTPLIAPWGSLLLSIMIANFKSYVTIKLENINKLNDVTLDTKRFLIMFSPASQPTLCSKLVCLGVANDSQMNITTLNEFTLTKSSNAITCTLVPLLWSQNLVNLF